jgi:hypothetical protein
MADIIIDTDWFKPAPVEPPLVRLPRLLRIHARLWRRTSYRRRLLRSLRVETLDDRLLEDIGVAVPRGGYDRVSWLVWAQGGNQ